MRNTRSFVSRGVLVLNGVLACVIVLAIARTAAAVPTGSMGLLTFDAQGNHLANYDLRVEHFAGNWVIEPIDVTTDIGGLTWVSVPEGTYAIYAIGQSGEPFPEPAAIVFVPGGAMDLLVPMIVPPPCPGDFNDDRAIDATDLVAMILDWGPCLQCATDANDDGQVNVTDLVTLITSWGDCPE